MRKSFRRSRKGLDTIVAEVLMLLIIIIMSSIVFIWVVPTFQSSEVGGNSGATYSEKFSTLWGNFATFAASIPESVTQFNPDPWSKDNTCNGTINSAFAGNVYVPVNGNCVITATVGNVYVDTGGNLTVIGTTINGGLEAFHSLSVTLKNSNVAGWTGMTDVQAISITGSSLNTSQNTGTCTDACDSAMYEGGRGSFSFVNNTVYGQIESEVGHQSVFRSNNVIGRLEVESADFGQIVNNHAQVLDLDQNGILVISGNTLTGNDPYFSGPALRYGFNRWCAAGNNVVSGSTSGSCIGNIEIDLVNTGNLPVNLVAAYMSNVALAGPISWKLLSGGAIHNSLPITIPVGQGANVTMQWTPPVNVGTLPWTDIYFVFVSSHGNYVDGHIYFGYNPALTVTGQSRPVNQVCPPCY